MDSFSMEELQNLQDEQESEDLTFKLPNTSTNGYNRKQRFSWSIYRP